MNFKISITIYDVDVYNINQLNCILNKAINIVVCKLLFYQIKKVV